MATLEQQFEAWERFVRSNPMRRIRHLEEGIELYTDDNIQELWAQLYVLLEFRELGFVKVKGPYRKGPDFRVSRKRRWAWAEVETRWQNYFRHGHHLSAAFDRVEYLILLSSDAPVANKLAELPPKIIYIDRRRFQAWFERALSDNLRIELLAGAMQEYWTTICSDREREMAQCPNCDNCPYFGEGMFREATPFFLNSAVRFISRAVATAPGWN